MVAVNFAAIAAAVLAGVARASLYNESSVNHTCFLEPLVLSCSAQAQPNLVDTCCTETFGGLLLSTQFWSTWTGLESEGQLLPPDTWTLHGLWPDYCNGGPKFCGEKMSPLLIPSSRFIHTVLRFDPPVRPGTSAKHYERPPKRYSRSCVQGTQHRNFRPEVWQVRPPGMDEQVLGQPRRSEQRFLGPRVL